MADSLLVDEGFWEVLEGLLPERPRPRTGRPRVNDRAAFTAIMFVRERFAELVERLELHPPDQALPEL